jgi:hypothetical protein
MQAPTYSRDSPSRRGCLTRGGICPCAMGWQLAVIAVGAPTMGTSVVVSPISHHGQWSRASFKISSRERWLPLQLAEDQKSKVSGFRPNSLKTKRPKEQELQDHAGAVACGCISGPHSNPTWVREWGGYM